MDFDELLREAEEAEASNVHFPNTPEDPPPIIEGLLEGVSRLPGTKEPRVRECVRNESACTERTFTAECVKLRELRRRVSATKQAHEKAVEEYGKGLARACIVMINRS